ncbi:DNA-binding anti-repressor SinI [Neobacillus sp. FSL H8-0543]
METNIQNQWEELLREARDMGLSIDSVREFFEQMKKNNQVTRE